MKTRMIALFLTLAMVVSLAPAVVADDTIPRPTVDEILNEYHQKAFEAKAAGEAIAASYSPRSGFTARTLEQETVDNLNDAGYEAYNVTAENYEALETQLKTDFADMGLDPDGSYIIAISGEESEDSSASGINPRAMVPVEPDHGCGGSFTHTYNGKTYTMRYVTVTATENDQLKRYKSFDLYKDDSVNGISTYLDWQFTIISAACTLLGVPSYSSNTYSLISLISPNIDIDQLEGAVYSAATNWTVTYTQVYNSQKNVWRLCAGVDRAAKNYAITYSYYDSTTDTCKFELVEGVLDIEYSKYYENKSLLKDYAALAYENNCRYLDVIEVVEYQYKGTTVITHNRWNEYVDYEPA